jgi:hypothetical protein
VVGHPWRVDRVGQPAQPPQLRAIDAVGRADVRRHRVRHERIARAELRERVARPAAVAVVVLGEDLEAVDHRGRRRQDRLDVRGAQAQADRTAPGRARLAPRRHR